MKAVKVSDLIEIVRYSRGAQHASKKIHTLPNILNVLPAALKQSVFRYIGKITSASISRFTFLNFYHDYPL
jgi:uncharacterized protein involved in propanediol utilization